MEQGFFLDEDLDSMSAWLADLQAIDYSFPVVYKAEHERTQPKLILAAFCFSGERCFLLQGMQYP